ncbi:hypothetical protein ECDEC1B_3521 [Escherichia coli DEC1B]|uniref:Uncharacterized protein n=1 Tax=Escherichia coli DEC2D TaxID=868141 RepID=A0A828U5E7_ECOLX|nr:hypothetical protein ECDEC1B_3521 [Escherichia coli DEC1B]EHU31103.1 hypothetical protein ECDEC1D_5393 [Escherichia coli DEC1D]EHU41968.1 hypothetical protein ECDEC2D_3537 [Escherichia coli DEC2D]
MGRWWRYKWITFHPSLTKAHGEKRKKAQYVSLLPPAGGNKYKTVF